MGREEQLRLLGEGLGAALDAQGGLYVVFGEAGMGKTRLAEWTAERAREQGARVFWGRCWETVDTPAYWPWSQVIRQTLEPLSVEEREALVGPARSTIERMVPDLVSPPAMRGEAITRIVEFDSLIGFFRRAAERGPIVLVIEDLHASDESSQLLLQYLAREIRYEKIFIVATCDLSGMDARSTGGSFIAEVAREGTSVYLRGIDEDAITNLYESLVGHQPASAIVTGLHSATEGNPLFLTEAIAMLSVTGDLRRSDHSTGFRVPRNVGDMFRRRLAALTEETYALLTFASVIGREFDVSLLAQVAALDWQMTLDLLDGAAALGAIQEAGALGRYRFGHVLIRETVYEDLSPANRMRVHRLVAEALEESGTGATDEGLAALAHHWFKAAQAGDPSKALDYTEKAAAQALTSGAHEEAARLYQRALQVAERASAPSDRTDALKSAILATRSATGSIYPEINTSAQELRFAREGEYWTIIYQANTSRLKDSKGLAFLSQLLVAPGREFHALDLVNAVEGTAHSGAKAREDNLGSVGLGDAGELLDAAAKSAYRSRIVDLRADIEEAQTYNDPERAARAQEEMDAIVGQLSGAVGLGGRDRKAASASERARVSVTKTIKDAVRKISENDPFLGSHLVSTVKTGTYCSYSPDPRVPVEWRT